MPCIHLPARGTARSRTSGDYLFVVLLMMLHPTQELEPPANPGRFISRQLAEWAGGLDRVGMETGLLAVWFWSALLMANLL